MKKKPPDDNNNKNNNLKSNSTNNIDVKIRNKINNAVDDAAGCNDDDNNNNDDEADAANKFNEGFWLNANEDAKIQIWPYKKSAWKTFLSNFFIVLTFGFLRLIYFWKPEWQIRCMCVSCPLKEADCVLIRDESYQYFLRYVLQAKTKLSTDDGGFTIMDDYGEANVVGSYRFFTHQKVLFVWNQRLEKFRRVQSFDNGVLLAKFHQCQPLTNAEAASRGAVYGPNEISVLSPFYAFQAFSILMWCLDYYYFYSAIIALVSIVTITIDVYQIRQNQRALKNAIVSSDVVTLMRDGGGRSSPETVESTRLVPGDIIYIPPHGCVMQCDAVLLTGTCIVNESMLTGESVPVTKTHLPYVASDPSDSYDDKKHAKHTLYNGTRVLQTRYYAGQPVKAVVIRTGFNTMKGQLVRSIMYPKPVDFEFTKDLLRFVMVLAVIAVAGFIYSTAIMSVHDIDVGRIIIDSLNVICTVVPAALPAAMSIGIIVAKRRIEKREIYCISPSTINTCGAVNAVCFDKTGTLTEEGLDLMGVLPAEKNSLVGLVESPANLGDSNELVRCMACCHSLARINSELVGDPLDLILFRQTEWMLQEPDVVDETSRFDLLAPTVVRPNEKSSVEIGILRQFTFSSSLQRMSVVVRVLGDSNLILYCKGAPETIALLSTPESVPCDFNEILYDYAKKGYRVLAVARRVLDVTFVKAQRASREELESELEFLGLVILENRLKPETTPVIGQLKSASMRTVMVTGDNILTAISVARECGILDVVRPLYIVEANASPPTIKVKLEDGSAPNKMTMVQFGTNNNNEKVTLFEWDVEHAGREAKKMIKADYQLAISGPSFAVVAKHFPQIMPHLVAVCDVFARMGPEQKAQFVHSMQELNYVVSMCGDGANDCGALKAAHVGISLSEAEASIASPFTSKRSNISCVPTLVREGRAALVTSFGVFKFMALYSLNIFMTGCILQWIGSDMADFQYLYIDLFLISVVAISFGYTPASDVLSPQRPPTKILSLPSVSSIFVQISIFTAFQVFAFEFVKFQPWFIPFVNPQDEANPKSFQTTAVFFTSVFQYNIMAVIYSKSLPHRKTLFYNRFLFVWLFISTSVSVWLAVYPPDFVVNILLLQMPPKVRYRVLIVFAAALNFLLSCLSEWYLVDWFLTKFVDENGRCKGSTPPKYVTILEDICRSVSWLQMTPSVTVCDEENEEITTTTTTSVSNSLPSPSLSDVSNNNFSVSADDNSSEVVVVSIK